MGQKYLLTGAQFTDAAYPILQDDQILNSGSLLLLDFGHSLATPASGVPANLDTVYNIAWEKAAALIGSGDVNSLAGVWKNALTGAEALFERTTKKALHGIVSAGKTSQNNAYFEPSLIIRDYMRNNPTRNYALFVWYRVTRAGISTNNMREYIVANSSTPASNALFNGNYANSLITARITDNKPSGYAGTIPPADGNHILSLPAWGNTRGYTVLNTTGSKSHILYRLHLVDVAASGMTYDEINALDLEMFNAAFAEGGRFYNDSFTDPSTLP